jgi:hypothetical protein
MRGREDEGSHGRSKRAWALLWAGGILILLSLPTQAPSAQVEQHLEVEVEAIAAAVHALIFAIQAWLLHRAWAPSTAFGEHRTLRPEVQAFLAAAAYGGLTELYQGLLPHRSAQPKDFLADALGAAAAAILLGLWRHQVAPRLLSSRAGKFPKAD